LPTYRIQPAELAFDDTGTPFSHRYNDVYHSADSGPGQARHVFIAGNDLPRSWAGARVFAILETGFGLGLNFLATWHAWREDPERPERLHFVSIEKHPFDRATLETLHARYVGLAPLAARLQAAWPPLVPGFHRLQFEDERVTLTLAFGDVAALLPRLRLYADAIYLDGFAPDHNAEMWTPRVMKGLARLAHPGTTLATWSTARVVREGLEAAGFTLEKRAGFGHKREMLSGRYAPRWPVRRKSQRATPPASRHAIVVGAGLAGAAVCERLAARGWRIDLIERGTPPTIPSPSRFAGVFHPHVSADDCILSRIARNGFLYAVSRWLALERAGHALAWSRCGVLQLSAANAALDYPDDYAQHVARDRAAALSGSPVGSGGWWFPGGGWMRPASLVAAQLAAADAKLTPHFGTTVDAICRDGESWQALAANGSVIATAPVLVLANSNDSTRLVSLGQTLERVRGQVTYVPAESVAAPRTIVTGAGHVLPAIDGIVVTGSTYDRDGDSQPQLRGHEANVARLSRMLPGALGEIDASMLDGAVGFRSVAPDRLPLAGAVPDVDEARSRKADLAGAHLADLPRHAGLYCIAGFASRGLIWSALAGEIVASLLEGEPLPLEGDLADALDPARFVLRRLRAGTL
jgi:tRNA 5-methylaminomethyl-2-thiouridine biosynthesis bifunctional protein